MTKYKTLDKLISCFVASAMSLCAMLGAVPSLSRANEVNAANLNPVNPAIVSPSGSGNLDLSSGVTANGGNFDVTLDVTGNYVVGEYKEVISYIGNTVVNTTSNGSYTIPSGGAGWYAIQIQGGHGGNGAGASAGNGASARGGYGAAGTYIVGYIHLNEGQTISYTVGSNGNTPADAYIEKYSLTKKALGEGGEKGGYTSVSIDGTGTVIAGGGGGGGGAGAGSEGKMGGDASNGNNMDTSYAGAIKDSHLSKDGDDGYALYGVTATGGDAGQSGWSYNGLPNGNLSGQGNAANNYNSLSSLSDDTGAVVVTCLELDSHLVSELPTLDEVKASLANSMNNNFSLTAGLSDYFDVVSVSSSNGTCTNSSSGNTINVTDIVPTITYSGEDTVARSDEGYSYYDITATANFTIIITLAPKTGFLGGNDVPLITSGITLTRGSETDTVGSAVNVNVAIPNPTLEVADITIDCGDSATKGDMITSVTADPGDWKSDFVTITSTNGADTISPTATTEYELFVKIAPATVVPTSTIGNAATEQSLTKTATCYVNYSVNFALTNMETKASETIDGTSDYNTTIVPSDGYLLPDTVIITVAGETLDASSYTYDNASGSITIPKDFITGNIVIGAEAPADKLDLTYSYEVPADGDTFDTETYVEAYVAGETIDKTFINDFVPETVEGYSFAWDWNTTDNVPLDTMPDEAWTVTGRYSINDYKLTVTYVYAEGSTPVTPSPTPYEEDVTYKETYSVTSPTIEGYTPDIEVVSGTMGGEAKNVTVTYTPNPHNLKIIYKLADTGEVYDTYEHTYGTDEAYNVTSLRITGYEPDVAAVTGTMGLENVEVTVTYSLKEYTLTIKYLDSDDEDNPMIDPATGLAIPDYVEQVPYKGTYSVTSPIIANHQCSDETVEGEMGASNLTVCVYYSDSIVSIIVEWGDLVYDLTYDNAWDPEGHTYGDNKVTLTPETEGQNFIKVTNNSTSLDVNIALSYSAATEFSTLDGWFTGSAADATKITGYELDAGGKSNKVYLWLGGTLENTSSKEFISGQVTVTISGGN